MIIYHSGTPGIRGGLPEELLDQSVSVMTSMVEYGSRGERIADRRMDRIIEDRNVDLPFGCLSGE